MSALVRQFFFVYNAICRPSLRLQFCFIRASKQLGEIVGSCSRLVTTLDRADVRFARPNIQIYDAYVVDLYQWVCARYFVGVEVQKQRQSAVKLGSRPNFRTDHAGFQNPVPPRTIRGSTIEKQRFALYFNMMAERVTAILLDLYH